MKTILLTQDKATLVDDADFDWLNQWKWCAHRRRNGEFYAVRTSHSDGKTIRMHRLILGTPAGMETDHRDGDGLNNTRANLRILTNENNHFAFLRKRSGASSQYRGVSFNSSTNKWVAQIAKSGKVFYLGLHECEIDAAKAYDEAAKGLFGGFASPNIL